MRATLRIQARIRQPQPLQRSSMHKMFVHNLVHVFHVNKPIPDSVRVHHHNRPMLALVQATQFVSADLSLQPGLLHGILESRFQLPAVLPAAAWSSGVLVPLVGTNKNVMPELCQS
jgi:hypothetical protein